MSLLFASATRSGFNRLFSTSPRWIATLKDNGVNTTRRLFSSSPQSSPGWIARVKDNGVQDLVSGDGFTTNGKFDECARSLRVISVDEESGAVLARLQVEEHLCNSYDTMHVGFERSKSQTRWQKSATLTETSFARARRFASPHAHEKGRDPRAGRAQRAGPD